MNLKSLMNCMIFLKTIHHRPHCSAESANNRADEIYDFDDMFVLDYIFSYQLDANIAKKNLSNNLDKLFMGLNISDKAYISKVILSIAENYPNFNYKGHTYNEIKNKYK